MTALLITLHVVSCVVLILVVLLQAGRGADMGAAFGGASTPMFGSGSASNPLARVTTITAVMFLTTALVLAVASARRASVFDSTPEPLAATPQAESTATALPSAPPPLGAAAEVPEAKPLTIPASPDAAGGAEPAAEAAPVESEPAAPAAASAPAAAPESAPAVPAPAPDAAPAGEGEAAPPVH